MSDDIIIHFGVKGMRWGVRKQEETSPRQARREKKAQKYEDRAKAFQKNIDELMQEPAGTWLKQRSVDKQTRKLAIARDQAKKDAEAKRQGKLTDRQRKVAIGATVAVAIIAATATYHAAQSGEINRLSMRGKAFFHGQGSPTWKRADHLASKDLDVDALKKLVVDRCNPNYGAPGTKVNCRRSTFAYEMRRRGYDVSATRTTNANGQSVGGLINATSPGQKRVPSSAGGIVSRLFSEEVKKTSNPEAATPFTDAVKRFGTVGAQEVPVGMTGRNGAARSIFEALATQPSGARGELGVTWSMGGGHSMAWEIVRGQPVVFDTQSGRVYRTIDELSKITAVSSAGFTRLDNVPLNEDFLMRWLKNA